MLKSLLTLILFFISNLSMAIEEPKFVSSDIEAPFEIRQYESILIAEVLVEGTRDEASNKGFRLIAAYIFGQNQVNEKISMTAPVTVEEQNIKSEKIAMTAPVGIEPNAGKWTVSFVMPAQYTMESLPKPLNDKVQLRQISAVKRAVVSFSGFYDTQKVAEKTLELEMWMKTRNLQANGAPHFARYNPPWTLPFMRRNEIMITVRD